MSRNCAGGNEATIARARCVLRILSPRGRVKERDFKETRERPNPKISWNEKNCIQENFLWDHGTMMFEV